MANTTYSRIYTVVRRVPAGRVASYGQIAGVVGLGGARQVGYALHALPRGTSVPWHRVLNAQGRISLLNHHALTQRLLLEREGVRFDARGRVDLVKFGWRPRGSRITRRKS